MLRVKNYSLFQADLFAAGIVIFTLANRHLSFKRDKKDDKLYKFIIEEKLDQFWEVHNNYSKSKCLCSSPLVEDYISKELKNLLCFREC